MHKVLEKQLEKTNKINELKLEKEREVENYRNIAIKSMIQKEKTQEALFIIAKSPNSRAAQERLHQLSIVKKEETPPESRE